MVRISRHLAVLGGLVLMTAAPGWTQAASPTIAAPEQNSAVRDLNTLIQAHVQEAATLKGELPSLKDQPAASRMFETLVQSHLKQAHQLAALERQQGETPVLLAPPGTPTTGPLMAVVQDTVTTEESILSTVRGIEARSETTDKAVLRQQDQLLRHNINLLRSLVAARIGTATTVTNVRGTSSSRTFATTAARSRAYTRLQRAYAQRTRRAELSAARRQARRLRRAYHALPTRRYHRYRPLY